MLPKYTIDSITAYLQQTIGIDAEVKDTGQRELAGLPIFLRNGYEYHRVHIYGKDAVFAIARGTGTPSPDQLKKQGERLQHELASRVVFVFERLEAYQRKRLIQKKIAFMVPGKQMYIPFLFIDLNETQNKPQEDREKLRPASQCLLLYHLQVERLEGISFKEIASKLRYSGMTITRAAKELEVAGLAETTGSREKNLKLNNSRRELWQESKHLLLSPVKERVFVSQPPEETPIFKANQAALEHYSDLASGRQQTYAIGDEAYRRLKGRDELKDLNAIGGEYALELWSYDPGLLAEADLVDPLSLYLSMMDVADERVGIALDQLLENITW